MTRAKTHAGAANVRVGVVRAVWALVAAVLVGAAGPGTVPAGARSAAPAGSAPWLREAYAAEPLELTVFAAASLTDAFREIAARFERENPGLRVVLNFGGSPQLRVQIEQGARADVFASANQPQMDLLKRGGLVAGADRVFARNRLVVIVPKDNPARIERLQDLGRPGVRFVTTHPSVPVGGYTRAALEKMSLAPGFGADFARRVAANIVSEEDNVKQVVAKVQLGEADAGVVYSSDVTPAVRRDVAIIPIPDPYNELAVYPIAVLKNARAPDAARRFVDFVLSEAGQERLVAHGFLPAAATQPPRN